MCSCLFMYLCFVYVLFARPELPPQEAVRAIRRHAEAGGVHLIAICVYIYI